MPIIIRDLKLSLDKNEGELLACAANRTGVNLRDIENLRIVRMSLDARKKQDIHYKCTVKMFLEEKTEKRVLQKAIAGVEKAPERTQREPSMGTEPMTQRPFVIGSGPCGMFAALTLAKYGYRPIVVERGRDADDRGKAVDRLWTKGVLDQESNVLFGEGGAGMFSDGKLTTRTKDPRSDDVLQALCAMGGPAEIEYMAKPHIGTDVLRNVIKNIRAQIESLGGEYWFSTKLTDITLESGELTKVTLEGEKAGTYHACACILAIGHSARDTYELLLEKGIALQAKAFAVGVRIEHPRELIDAAQYGPLGGDQRLGAAEYALTANGPRGIYTFCMCPGGQVVCSSSEHNGLVTNGMSYHARVGENSNSAIIVQVGPQDFGSGPLGGVEFQRELEENAYRAGGGGFIAPGQRLDDFIKNRPTKAFGSVRPTYAPGVTGTNLNDILPPFCSKGIREALPVFASRLKGFDLPEAVLTGVESRSSAPVRILRDQTGQSAPGVYPAGEGAGYAGGIISAAVDGIRAAEGVMARFSFKGNINI